MVRSLLLLLILPAGLAVADVSQCACDPRRPETMKARECSLCAEAEKQPAGIDFFVLKDINPRKPNRWLVLPRAHGEGPHHLSDMSKRDRDRYWKFAVEAARAKFGDDWGLAYNGENVRTQCHLHLHMGPWIRAAENSKVRTVRSVAEIPVPREGGLWIHAVKGGIHVHAGEDIMETALVR